MANPRKKDTYLNDVVPALKEKFQYSSIMQVPKLTKIVLNKGIGAAVADKKLVDQGVEELSFDHWSTRCSYQVQDRGLQL